MILTCEERQVVYDEIHFLPHKGVLDPYLKAQLKKVHSWGDEPCPHFKVVGMTGVRHQCMECWQVLEEVKE